MARQVQRTHQGATWRSSHNEILKDPASVWNGVVAARSPRDSPSVEPELQAIVEAIHQRYRPERIILFGSHAWGTPRDDSDVDLFIIKDTDTPPWRRGGDVRRLVREEKRGLAMDLLVYTPAEVDRELAEGNPFIARVLREGLTLYAA